jgi:hypothetical protein
MYISKAHISTYLTDNFTERRFVYWPVSGLIVRSQSLYRETELLLSKPVRRWRRLYHMIYCSDVTFVNNKLWMAEGSWQPPLFVRRLDQPTVLMCPRLGYNKCWLNSGDIWHGLAITKWLEIQKITGCRLPSRSISQLRSSELLWNE